MLKFLLALVVVASLQPQNARASEVDENESQQALADAMASVDQFDSRRGEEIVAGVVGGIIGAAVNEAFDRRPGYNDGYDRPGRPGYGRPHRPDFGRPDYGRPGRPGRPGYPGRPDYGRPDYGRPGYGRPPGHGRPPMPPPPPQQNVTCTAQNNFGQLFQARGFDYGQTSQAALNSCYQTSPYCQVLECRNAW